MIDERLGTPAASQALVFLEKYRHLRELAKAHYLKGTDPGGYADRLALLKQIQEQAFGSALAQQLFGDENRVSALRLQRIEIMQDPDISVAEQARVISDIVEQLPPTAKTVYQRNINYSQLAQTTREMREQGASAEALWDLRAKAYGSEAAYRLQTLDEQRSQWQLRLEDFRQQRALILQDPKIDEEEKAQRLAILEQASFTRQELLRVGVIVD